MKCFRKLKETTWIKTEDQLNENSIVVKGLEPGHTYQFRVVAVDGELLINSYPILILRYIISQLAIGKCKS